MRSSGHLMRLQAAQCLILLAGAMIIGCPLEWLCVRWLHG